MTVLPVLPAAFRFRRDRDTGKPARIRLDRPSKTLDEHYARIIAVNNELRALQQDQAEETALQKQREEQLQRAIFRLFRGVPGRDDVECLERLIKGKHGVFRQAVLGKRTDYSGRAVIVPDPTLALDECRLPYRMGMELFRPWLKRALQVEESNIPVIAKVLAAQPTKKTRKRVKPVVSLDEIIEKILSAPEESAHRQAIEQVWPEALKIGDHERVCVLNRAPTLHKFNLLAFKPTLWDEDVIAIPPLVCAGYNADFDGDTMAVHVPLTAVSQQEARARLLPSQNLFSSANGKLILHFAQDIVAGLAYNEVKKHGQLPEQWNLREQVEQAGNIVQEAEARMREGFEQATRAGLSFGLFDIPLIENRQAILHDALEGTPVAAFYDGTLDEDAREKIVDEWKQRVTQAIERRLEEGIKQHPLNTLALLTLSRARGDVGTVTQLGGMRGLMERGSTDYTTYPIEANFIEGLSPVEFFFSTFGSRASLVDKKLKVAAAGDFTRRLVNCAYNVRITCDDCKTTKKPRSVLICEAADGICQQCYGEALDTKHLPLIDCPVGLIAATSIGERGTQLSMRTFHTGGVKGDNITRGLPHIDALLENRWVKVPVFSFNDEEFNRWEKHLKEARGENLADVQPLTDRYVHLRLGEVACTVEEAQTIVLGEAYQSYKRDDLKDPRLFAVILRAMIRWENGNMRIRGLTQAARENLHPLERVAFRDAIKGARENAERSEAQAITGAQEKVMVANL